MVSSFKAIRAYHQLMAHTEFFSALSLNVPTKQRTPTAQSFAFAAFREGVETSFHLLSVSHENFVRAAIFANQPALNLRAGDALRACVA